MKRNLLFVVVLLVALAGWSEVSYQGVAMGSPWEDLPFLDDMFPAEDASAPGDVFGRRGEILDTPVVEQWYRMNGEVAGVMIAVDNDLHDRVFGILEEKYGVNLSKEYKGYIGFVDGVVIMLDYGLPESTLMYGTVALFTGSEEIVAKRNAESGL